MVNQVDKSGNYISSTGETVLVEVRIATWY